MSKPKLGYLLFDLPGDHEIEGALATECKTVEAVIHNRGMKARIKRICVASETSFRKVPTYKYGVQFVHLACHGSKTGIWMLGGRMSWKEVASQIKRHLHPLKANEKRVIVFSCCQSEAGFDATRASLAGYFTGAYHFKKRYVPFAQAIATWAMFYLKKDLANPHGAIVKAINDFMGEEALRFRSYP